MLLPKASARTIYLLKRVETLVRGELETELREFVLTPAQYTTLSLLKANNEISSAALARRCAISPQSMSETIMALEKKGLLERRERPVNRRILGIELSAAGRQLLSDCEQRVNALERKLLAPLQATEIEMLRSLLARLLEKAQDDRL